MKRHVRALILCAALGLLTVFLLPAALVWAAADKLLQWLE